jgi:hypothetical protein
MAYQWPLDKVGLINSALILTGDNLVAAADDGSDEWNVASAAYERGLGYASESHNWGFSKVVKVLTASPTAPPDTQWDTAYPIPQDCIHIIWLKINQDTSDALNQQTSQPTLYDLQNVGGVPCIVTNAQGGPPPPPVGSGVVPAIVTICYISNAGALSDSTMGTPTLILALQSFVQAGIYSGLHEDTGEAEKLWAFGEKMLQMARTRYDQQKPKRQFFNSRIYAARRIRRPWPPNGLGGWGGPGSAPG